MSKRGILYKLTPTIIPATVEDPGSDDGDDCNLHWSGQSTHPFLEDVREGLCGREPGPFSKQRLGYIRHELALMRQRSEEVHARGKHIIRFSQNRFDDQRDLLHLQARTEGIVAQLDDMIKVADRIIDRMKLQDG